MKKILILAFSLILLSMMVGCASTKKVAASDNQKTKIEAPDWYLRGAKKSADGIYAIGRSNLSDSAMAEKAARVDGRAALAQMIESKVSHAVDTYSEYDKDTKHYLKESTRIVSNQVLVGSTQVDKFEFNGEVSVLMFLPYEDMLKQLKSSAEKQEDANLRDFLNNLTVEQLEN